MNFSEYHLNNIIYIQIYLYFLHKDFNISHKLNISLLAALINRGIK